MINKTTMEKMEKKTIILYSIEEHLNSMLLLASFIAKNDPSISIIILSTAPDSVAASLTGKSSITYRQLPSITLPPTPPSTDIVELFFTTPRLQNPILQEAIEEISTKTKINAFIIDYFCYASLEVSTSMNIPTYFYISSGAFSLCAMLYFPVIDERIAEDIGNLNDFIEIPGCPPIHSLDFPKGQFFRKSNTYKHFMCAFKEVMKSTGIIVHTFDALEYRAKEALSNGLCNPDGKTPPVYYMGPFVTEITKKDSENECLKWLDTQPEKSVIFLCFGRRGLFSKQQLQEIAIGLEKSGHRFLWSVRSPPGHPDSDPDLDKLLPEGFVERTKERGFVIKKWAPQKEVLSHESVSGFVTHCGWSSVLESVLYGVPMIGFPMYAEQRMNKVFMVEEMKIALPLEEESEGFVKAAELEKRVRELMESKTTGKAIKARVAELKISADSALKKGGSSVTALEKFVRSLCHEI